MTASSDGELGVCRLQNLDCITNFLRIGWSEDARRSENFGKRPELLVFVVVNFAAGIKDKGPGSGGKTNATRVPSNLSCLSRCLRLDYYVAPRSEFDFGRSTGENTEKCAQLQSRPEQCGGMHSIAKIFVDSTLKPQIRPFYIQQFQE